MKQKYLMILCLIGLFLIIPANAGYNGNIFINDNRLATGTFTGGSNYVAAVPNWSIISFDITNYNLPNSINIYNVQNTSDITINYIHDAESTNFNIISGGIGSGWAYYDKSLKSLSWVFNVGSIATSSNIIISYQNNIFQNVSILTGNCAASVSGKGLILRTASSTYPILPGNGLIGTVYQDIYGFCGSPRTTPSYFSYTLGYGVGTNVSYNVSFPNPALPASANILINKSGTVSGTKTIVTDISNNIYTQESSFNTVNYNPTVVLTNGLRLNITVLTTSNNVLITGSSGIVTNATGSILFNKTGYDLHSDFNFLWNISNKNSSYGYYAVLKNSDTGETITSYPLYTATGNMIINNYMLLTPDQSNYYEVDLIERRDLYISNFLAYSQSFYGSTQQFTNSSVTGNFSILNINKTVIQGSYLNLKYNISSPGRIVIYDRVREYDYNIASGINTNYSIYIPNTFEISGSSIYLQYYDSFAGSYMTLFSDFFYVLPLANSSLTVQLDVYNQGDTITGHAYNSNTGFINILDPDGNIIYNQSIPAGSVYTYSYKTSLSSKPGTWTINLYDNTGVLLKFISIYLNQGMAAPIQTPGGSVAAPASLIEAGSSLTDAIFGKWTDENGEVSDVMIKKQGNSMFGVIFGIAFICLIAGAYWKIKGK